MSTRMLQRRSIALAGAIFLLLTVATIPVAAAGQLPGLFLGEAWGSQGNAKASQAMGSSGPSAFIACLCHGSNGAVRSNSIDRVGAGGAYRSGNVSSTAQAGKDDQMRASSQSASRVNNMRALGGLITAQSMRAVARVSANQSSMSVSHDGSLITGLRINGQPTTVHAGERIDLPGYGYAVFNNYRRFGDGTTVLGVKVEMLRIVITRSNDLHLPVGSAITVGHARAGYTRQQTLTVAGAAAWGSQASSTSSEVSNRFGQTAAAFTGCVASGTASKTNSVNSTTYPGTFVAGGVVSHASGQVGSSGASARASSRLNSVNLLGGILTADVIQGVASASVDGSGGHASLAGSRFSNLRIMGQQVGDNVSPNSTVLVPGLGSVTLYATSANHGANQGNASVDMVVLHVTQANTLGIRVGSKITLAHAQANVAP